ncbi:MAG: DUF1553 domain-containing protein [Planctomycetota bacterium]|nr:DUF1553 domain-containing protein [Planctomycetota bacterium]
MTPLSTCSALSALALALPFAGFCASLPGQDTTRVTFDEVRSIFAANCLTCHGPDENKRKGGPKGSDGLRLDNLAGLRMELDGGKHPVIPGAPDRSELLRRISTTGKDRMPPAGKGARLSNENIALVRRWIAQGAGWERIWSNVAPRRPSVPAANKQARNAIDHFVFHRLKSEGLRPSAEADRKTLLRRLSLDLTGLPPSPAEIDRFVADTSPNAFRAAVDRLLASPKFGERWAAPWLDLARYADSAGYADDPPRTIWAWRDWVIRAFNANMPFDQFTVEQLAGDLLPNPTPDQLVATAFHRNTMTNSEGGTIDEEFRAAAIVDRVNTTMSVWMGATANCAQCHTHKYDPLTHQEYFELYAFFNTSADNDRRNEAPLHKLYGPKQETSRRQWQNEVAKINTGLDVSNPSLQQKLLAWDQNFPRDTSWRPAEIEQANGSRLAALPTDVAALRFRPSENPKPGRLQASARVVSAGGPKSATGRFVRIALPGKAKNLHLAEVQVFKGKANLARQGKARQSSTGYNGPARLANDGNTDGHYERAKSTSHTATSDNPWWEVDLGKDTQIDRVVIWNRTDSDLGLKRLNNFTVTVLDSQRQSAWHKTIGPAPNPSLALSPTNNRTVKLSATYQEPGGHWVALLHKPTSLAKGERLELRLKDKGDKPLALTALGTSNNGGFTSYAHAPSAALHALATQREHRSKAHRASLKQGYLLSARDRRVATARRVDLESKIKALKPMTTVPIMQELAKPRKTHIQIRGSYKDLGKLVGLGVPAAFPALQDKAPQNRLGLARWIVSRDNPRTARVTVNRFWEQLFGAGLVTTTGDFGVQGERPSHPDLLDWLAVEFMDSGWDTKALLRTIVSSATYRQNSDASPDLVKRDPRNKWLGRGPRFRLSAEMIRDSALAASGLLSDKMYGASVRPPRPKLGLRAAFGGSTDWATSPGQDRFRRGLYTTWRRTIPYPSMATFDAPSREVCTVARIRTNTPLQALVTLNDPVYVEAAQALARRLLSEGGADVQSRIRYGFRLCLSREPSQRESARLVDLQEKARLRFAGTPKEARKFATDPLGSPPAGIAIDKLAAWTLVANVLLNLDEFLVKR